MLVFTIMISLPSLTDATQWAAIEFVIFFNLFIGYGWVGEAWLYGAELRLSQCFQRICTYHHLDYTSQVPTYRHCIQCFWRVALVIHYCLRWGHCHHECWLEDMDLAATFMCMRHHVRVFQVSRGK